MDEMNQNLGLENEAGTKASLIPEAESMAPAMPETASEPWESSYQGEAAAGKRKSIAPIIVGGVALLLIAIIAVCLFVPSVNNKLMKAFMSPKNYYQRVENSYCASLAKDVKDFYAKGVNTYEKGDAQSAVIKAELSQEFFEEAGITDFPLKSVDIHVDAITKDNGVMGEIVFGLNGEQLITLEEIMKDGIYFRLTELNPQWVGTLFEDENMDCVSEILDTLTADKLEKMLVTYSGIVASSFETVTAEETNAVLGDISVPATVYTLPVDQAFADHLEASLKAELLKDKTMQELYAISLKMDSVEEPVSYEEWVEDFCDDLKFEIEYALDDGDTMYMTVTVDGKGDIIGREFCKESGSEGSTGDNRFGYLEAASGKDYALSAWKNETYRSADGDFGYQSNQTVDLTGSYAGTKLSGTVTARNETTYDDGDSYGDTFTATLRDYELIDKLKGRFSGVLEIEITDEYDEDNTTVIVITAEPSDKSQTIKASISYGDIEMLILTVESLEGSKLEGQKIEAPSDFLNLEDDEAMDKWLEGIDQDYIQKLMDNEVIGGFFSQFLLGASAYDDSDYDYDYDDDYSDYEDYDYNYDDDDYFN